MKTRKKTLFGWLCCVAIAFLVALVYLFVDLQTFVARNGEEYTEALLDGQIYSQELMLNNTAAVNIGLLPAYTNPPASAGLKLVFSAGDKQNEVFFPLSRLANSQWTHVSIKNPNFFYKGEILLTIEAVELDYTNSATFLIATNLLQTDPECKFYKDGQEIATGRLNLNYDNWKIEQAAILFACVLFIAYIVGWLFQRLKSRTTLDAGSRYAAPTLGFFMFIFSFICNFDYLNVYNKVRRTQYLFSWQNLGFQKRSLIGTFIELFQINFDENSYVILGVAVILIALLLEMYLLMNCHSGLSQEHYNPLLYLLMCTPFFPTIYLEEALFGKFDIILTICFLLSCILIMKERLLFFIPILAIIAELIHEMYAPMFMPFLFVLLLYKFYKTKAKKYLWSLLSTSVSSVLLGCYLNLIHVNKTFEDAWAYIENRASASSVFDFPLTINFYVDFADYWYANWSQILLDNTIVLFICSTGILLPLIVLFALWVKEFYCLQRDKVGKMIVLLIPCTLVGLLVCMLTACDWGRWQVMYGTGVFFLFITLWAIDASTVKEAAKRAWGKMLPSIDSRSRLWYLCLYNVFITYLGGPRGVNAIYRTFLEVFFIT